MKTGEQLVGCLCGVSDYDLEEAEDNALNFIEVDVIESYRNGHELPYVTGRYMWRYAYPVPVEKIKKLRNFDNE